MRVETLYIQDFEDPEIGMLIDENDEWILVKHIPVDYVIDGYKIYRKKFIEDRINGENEQKIEKVLKLKKIDVDKPKGFEFNNTIGLLEWVEKKYGIFEFQDLDGSEVAYGKINEMNDGLLTIDFVDADGNVEVAYDYQYLVDDIRIITFETDYHTSIVLLYTDNHKMHGNNM